MEPQVTLTVDLGVCYAASCVLGFVIGFRWE